jgi:hypothetical protein
LTELVPFFPGWAAVSPLNGKVFMKTFKNGEAILNAFEKQMII